MAGQMAVRVPQKPLSLTILFNADINTLCLSPALYVCSTHRTQKKQAWNEETRLESLENLVMMLP